MISKDEYIFLKQMQNTNIKNENPLIKENEEMVLDLIHKNYLSHETFDSDYSITNKGKAAIEEYEQNQEQVSRENKTLKNNRISNIIAFIMAIFPIVTLIISIKGCSSK